MIYISPPMIVKMGFVGNYNRSKLNVISSKVLDILPSPYAD